MLNNGITSIQANARPYVTRFFPCSTYYTDPLLEKNNLCLSATEHSSPGYRDISQDQFDYYQPYTLI